MHYGLNKLKLNFMYFEVKFAMCISWNCSLKHWIIKNTNEVSDLVSLTGNGSGKYKLLAIFDTGQGPEVSIVRDNVLNIAWFYESVFFLCCYINKQI